MKLHKLTSAGVAHIIFPLMALVVIGGIGSFIATKSQSHADSSQVSCSYNGKTHDGHKEYNCGWSLPTPVISGSTNNKVDAFAASSTNWITCQQIGGTYHNGSNYNHWWAYTIGDNGKFGWVNAVYARGGVNNGSFGGGVPNCSGTRGAVPTLTSASGNSTTTTSRTFTYAAKDMYSDQMGPSSSASDGGVTVQIIAKGSKASFVNNVYDASLSGPLDKWVAANLGKKAKFCVTARSTGSSASLQFGINSGQSREITGIHASNTYTKYCSSSQTISNASRPQGSHVTMTINMDTRTSSGYAVPATSGPIRIKSASYELQ